MALLSGKKSWPLNEYLDHTRCRQKKNLPCKFLPSKYSGKNETAGKIPIPPQKKQSNDLCILPKFSTTSQNSPTYPGCCPSVPPKEWQPWRVRSTEIAERHHHVVLGENASRWKRRGEGECREVVVRRSSSGDFSVREETHCGQWLTNAEFLRHRFASQQPDLKYAGLAQWRRKVAYLRRNTNEPDTKSIHNPKS